MATRSSQKRSQVSVLELEVDTQSEQTGPLKASRGIFLAFCIVLGLAVNGGDSNIASDAANVNAIDGLAKTAVSNVIDASLPINPSDLLAVTLGESIGGIIGGVGTVLVTAFVRPGANRQATKFARTEALADTDYFIANSASLPLLQAAGLPPAVASIGSVIFATIPSQLVKISAQRQERLVEEESIMQELLRNQYLQQREQSFANRFRLGGASKENASGVDPNNLSPVVQNEIDTVEVFCDVTRWLEYNALQADFGSSIAWNNHLLNPAVSGAFFGVVAFVSSQLYADFLYGTFQFGPKKRQDEVASRSATDWLALYFSKALYAATLFGSYEFSQRPISRLIQGTLAGGVDGCIGSESFDTCLQTFIDTNSPGPSPEAQLRALATNLVMVGQRIQDVAVDTSAEDVKALVGAW
eukprot:CAMPEP_0117000346 /NCGR_PEP_ID=MMETSP0472-20121206/2722_1 /TAXON_ID=693140 ORGANISM="Tiarina fusus, Strain LIS" /NCGR_SAMPLE_ID=MMETSP0472 /ASSEMBLY_ACC=CAM_ASM_000603 /LENGTH=413 /DNA_ID=CAMNT_0004700015 /DNA_START=498 /DNA_END=1736 /DNA_ORIENTATION=-